MLYNMTMKILAGTSNLDLAQKIAQSLNTQVIQADISNFKNGERRVWIQDEVAGQNVAVVQSFTQPVDKHIVETLLLIDALERAGARHVSIIIPWMGYSLQDKVFRPGEPIAAKVVANIISNTYAKRVILFDLHNSSIPGFFNVPTHHVTALNLFAEYISQTFEMTESVVVSPDFGGLKRARTLADKLNLELANIDKDRNLKTGKVAIDKVSGDITGKICLIFDDVINTGGTVVEVAKFLKNHGAKEVHFLVTHGIFAGEALTAMTDPNIDSIVITNSIAHQSLPDKIKVLDASPLFAQTLNNWN